MTIFVLNLDGVCLVRFYHIKELFVRFFYFLFVLLARRLELFFARLAACT